jgi:hypothetical protein
MHNLLRKHFYIHNDGKDDVADVFLYFLSLQFASSIPSSEYRSNNKSFLGIAFPCFPAPCSLLFFLTSQKEDA